MQVNGTAVNFTFQSAAGIVITEQQGILLQSATQKQAAERKVIKDGNGDRVTSAWADFLKMVSLKWKVSGTGLANALANSSLLNLLPGGFITITSCPSMPDLVQANKYEIIGQPELSGTNEDVKEISLELESAANISGPAPA